MPNSTTACYRFVAEREDEGKRLDQFIGEKAADPGLTRTYIQKIIEAGDTEVNGQARGKNYRVHSGDVVEASIAQPQPLDARPQDISIDIVCEDDSVIVVNKQKGMVVHPAPGNPDGTLVNALLYHCKDLSGINGVLRPGIVHRIDKDTSGLLVTAKNDGAHLALARQIEDHSMAREYYAVVWGRFESKTGTVDQPIGRDPRNRKKYCVTAKNSKAAVTHYEVIEEFEEFSFIKCRLETGRTHQIRVHMAWMGHPVAGDTVYGTKKQVFEGLDGQCLHAGLLGFIHPKTGEYTEFSSELPEYFKSVLDRLRG